MQGASAERQSVTNHNAAIDLGLITFKCLCEISLLPYSLVLLSALLLLCLTSQQ